MSAHHSLVIADKAKAILEAGFGSVFKEYRRQPMLQVQPENLPALGVFILRERRAADGDANAGPVKFIVDLTLGLSASVQVDTDEVARMTWLEEAVAEIDDLLFTDADFVKLFEGVQSMDRLAQYAKMGEISLAEIRIEVTVRYRMFFEPKLTADFETLHVETRYPSAETDPAEVQQVVVQYDLPQN